MNKNNEFNITYTKNETKNNGFDFSGKITKLIGTGDDAKNSIAYLALKWSFGCLFLLIILSFLYAFYNKNCNTLFDNIVKVCGIITPTITLLLGYVFGNRKAGYIKRSRRKNHGNKIHIKN